MGITDAAIGLATGVTGAAVSMANAASGAAVDAYRRRLQAQVEQRRLDAVQWNMLLSASMAAVGMVADVVALQVRLHALQSAVDEAIAADDLVAAEQLRSQLVAALKEPTASAKLLTTLADYIPFLMAGQNHDPSRVIEGDVL